MMSMAESGQYLLSGGSATLVLVVLEPDGDPQELWSWTCENRPDLVDALAFVGGKESPLYEAEGVRHYADAPTAELLRADTTPMD